MRLNDALIANERYRGEPSTDEEGRTQWPLFILWDDELQGFGVRIFPPVRGKPSRKDFIVTWRVGLKSRTMAIGTYGVDCTLRQARRTARDALDLARRGQDPIEARHRALGIGTAEDLASRFLFEHTAAAKKKSVPGGEPALAPPDVAGATEVAEPPPASEVAEPAASPAAEVPGGAETPAVEGAPRVDAGGASVAAPETEPRPAPADPAAPGLADAAHAAAEAPVGATIPPAAAPVTTAGTPAPTPVAPHPPAPPPVAPSATAPRRGPTKVRLLPIPDDLHREIERRARALGLTLAAYLRDVVDRDTVGAATPVKVAGPPPAGDEEAPSPAELFARIEARQRVDVATVAADSFDDEEQSRRGE